MKELNAFHWRENYGMQLVTAPGARRRNAQQVEKLKVRVRTLLARGKEHEEIARTLGITRRYVQCLAAALKKEERCAK